MGDGRNISACFGGGVKIVKSIEQPGHVITVISIRFLYKGISGLAVTVVCCSWFRVYCRNMPLSENFSENIMNGNCLTKIFMVIAQDF